MELISSLAKAQAQLALESRLPQYTKTWLLINRCAEGCAYDELGYVPPRSEFCLSVLPADLPLLPARQHADHPKPTLHGVGGEGLRMNSDPLPGLPGTHPQALMWAGFCAARGQKAVDA